MKIENVKFKGKSIEESDFLCAKGGWVVGDFYRDGQHYCIVHPIAVNHCCEPISYKSTEVDPETVCMFTGLFDKNGKEIFEGDILAHDGKVIGHIVGGVRGYCYDVIYKCPKYEQSWSLYGVVVNDYKGNVEVVGNIIDNKDLLIS